MHFLCCASLLFPVFFRNFLVRAHYSACVAAVPSLQFGLYFSDFSDSYSSSWLSMNHILSFVPGIYFMFSSVFLDRGGGDSFYSRSSSLLRHYPLRRNRLPGRKSSRLCLRALRATFLCLQNYSAGPRSTFPMPYRATTGSTRFSFF